MPPPSHLARLRSPVTDRLRRPAWVLLVELFIGFGWARAVVEKALDPAWWDGRTVAAFVIDHTDEAVGWYRPIAVDVWLSLADAVALIVVALQAVAATTLITGRRVGIGLAAGMFLNLHFVLAGAVDPSIFYLVCQGALALRLLERRRDDSTREALEWLNVGAIVLVALCAPMIRTLDPARVIDDPAIVLTTFGALLFLTTATVLVRHTADEGAAAAAPPAPDRPTHTISDVGAAGRFRRF